MISIVTIEQLTQHYQTDKVTVIREYFQHLFLSYFYQEKETDKIYFKGGTALRIIYQSPRFSEDLDFSATNSTINSIENAIIATLTKINKEGIKTEIKESKSTTGGYIGVIIFSGFNMNIPIHLEISFRQGKKSGETITVVSDYLPSYTIVRLNEKKLINEKITALLTRQKPRDFYDFYFLLRSRLIQEKNNKMFEAVLKTLRESPIRFDKELKVFLPKSHHMIIRDFKKTLEQEIRRHI